VSGCPSSCSQSRRACQSHPGAASQRQGCCCHLLELGTRDEPSVGGIVVVHWKRPACGKLCTVTSSFCWCFSPVKLCSGESQGSETGVSSLLSSRPSVSTGSLPTFAFSKGFFPSQILKGARDVPLCSFQKRLYISAKNVTFLKLLLPLKCH